jgi:flagellar hook assembly protein FlgD
LRYFTSFGNGELSLPYDVAWDDRGTPFDNIDDMLWVVEQGQHRVSGYRMQLGGVQKMVEYAGANGFERLTSVAVGRFNGISAGELYVSDAATKSVFRLHYDGAALREISRYTGNAESQFESVGADHWGNVYVTDRSLKQIVKLNNRLEELAVLSAELEHDLTPLRFEPVFASVALAQTGEMFWSGYDQGFALEKWTESSGAQRLELGIDVARLQVKLDEVLSRISVISRLTDAGELTLEILNDAGQPVHSFPKVWQLAGEQISLWDRRDEQGRWVAPGYYRVRYGATSTYGTQLAKLETSLFYLPLFYHEDCGSHPANDAHLAQGFRSNKYGAAASQTVAQDEHKVVYRFNDLDPALAYEVSAEYFCGAGSVMQRLTVDEHELLAPQNVDMNATRTEWLKVPAESFTDGEIQIAVEKVGGSAPASMSQLWLRQANFDPNNPPAREMSSATLPREFELSQNYPNPFNPETTIGFSVPEGFSEAVELSIFNVMGQRVRTLVKGNLAAGRYAKVWNGRSDTGTRVASGVYFYRITAGSFAQTRKLLLMK